MSGTLLKRKPLLNQFGDYEDTTNMSCSDWTDRWKKGQTQFHMGQIHPMLQKHYKTITNNEKNLRFYVPLCGKSLDLTWLTKEGHEVVGSECCEEAIKEYFDVNEIPYTTEKVKGLDDGKVFKATDRKITIYKGDFFKLTSTIIGQFDCIWDRGSMVAIPVSKRVDYADIIVPLMKNHTRYLLDCFLVDNTVFGGPPFNCKDKDVDTLFGKSCKIEKIDNRNAFGKWQESWGIKSFEEEVYLLKIK